MPSARPRGMMVALCTDRWRDIQRDDRVAALMIGGQHFSCSVMTIVRRSAPIMILSFESSNSDMVRRACRGGRKQGCLVDEIHKIGAGKPGVPRATVFNSTSGARGTLRTCTLRMRSRPTMSGFDTTIWRSKRPGRKSAGSSTSGRFVAAIRMMLSLASKPSSRRGAGSRFARARHCRPEPGARCLRRRRFHR